MSTTASNLLSNQWLSYGLPLLKQIFTARRLALVFISFSPFFSWHNDSSNRHDSTENYLIRGDSWVENESNYGPSRRLEGDAPVSLFREAFDAARNVFIYFIVMSHHAASIGKHLSSGSVRFLKKANIRYSFDHRSRSFWLFGTKPSFL